MRPCLAALHRQRRAGTCIASRRGGMGRADVISRTPVVETEHYRAVFEHSPDGMLLTAPDGRILAANPAACSMLGRTEQEICLAGRAGLVLTDANAARLVEERSRTGHARGVLTLRRTDGTTFLADVASTVFRSAAGELRTSLSFRDVTEAERGRRALEILADAGRLLSRSLDPRTTLESLTGLVVPQLADVCSVDLLEPYGVTRVAVAHRDPTRIPAFEQVRRRAIRQDATGGVDYVLRTGEPSCVFHLTDEWLESATHDRAHFEAARALGVSSFVSVPLVAHSGTIGALTLMSDGGVPAFTEADLRLAQALGERAATAIENARRHEEALEARRMRDEVLAVVAHDLRGPLNAIQLAATVLEREHKSRETESIMRAVRRADSLIHDLLLATKMDTGAIPLELRRESIAAILDEVYTLHAHAAEAKSLRFVVAIDGELPRARVDRHRVVQMLSNLVSNAIKFTPPGGRVELRARTAPEGIVFSISDTGAGIARADIPYVFDRYWQGAHSRHLGAGLGLSISRGIANAHGGDISLVSELGNGTTFTVTLPHEAQAVAHLRGAG